MGQGPYGPGPIWARAHMGPGPLGPRPFLVGRTPHQKTHPGKRVQIVFVVVFWKQKKMRDVRTIILAAVSRRDLCYVSENKGFRFAKNKLILCPFSEKMCQIHRKGCQILTSHYLLPRSRGNGGGASAHRDLPSTCAGVRMT